MTFHRTGGNREGGKRASRVCASSGGELITHHYAHCRVGALRLAHQFGEREERLFLYYISMISRSQSFRVVFLFQTRAKAGNCQSIPKGVATPMKPPPPPMTVFEPWAGRYKRVKRAPAGDLGYPNSIAL